MINSLFVITSAINTQYSAFTAEQRLKQTQLSIATIRIFAPGAKIALVEMSATALAQAQVDRLKIDYYFDYGQDPEVQSIYSRFQDKGTIQNHIEVLVMGQVLSRLIKDKTTEQFDRIFKLSGRYYLLDNFDYAYYNTVPDKIVFLNRSHSWVEEKKNDGTDYMYMTRLYSWPATQTPVIIDALHQGYQEFGTYYTDIEHVLFRYLPQHLITEIPQLGVRGRIGHNGNEVTD
jgi:hypothetical protein